MLIVSGYWIYRPTDVHDCILLKCKCDKIFPKKRSYSLVISSPNHITTQEPSGTLLMGFMLVPLIIFTLAQKENKSETTTKTKRWPVYFTTTLFFCVFFQ